MRTGKTTIAALFGMIAVLAAVPAAQAITNTQFPGTRDQVRTGCAKVGGELIEGHDHSTCLNNKDGTGVTCDDSKQCWGSGPRLLGDNSPRLPPGPAMSLSESSGDASSSGAPSGASDPGAGPILGGDTSGGGTGGETGHIN